MKLSTCVVLAFGICVSSNAPFVRGENGTNNQTNQNSSDLNLQMHAYVSKMLREAFIKEFNLIMSNKSSIIQSLNEQIMEKDKIIKANKKNMMTRTSSIEGISEETNMSTSLKPTVTGNDWGLKYFVKKRIRILFQKELTDIIREKDAQIYLLRELLEEKVKTIRLQNKLRKRKSRMLGQGEPSGSY